MYNAQFAKFQNLKLYLDQIKLLCPNQYFSKQTCVGKCGKIHVDKTLYPCVHFYKGNCKYSFNCQFSHKIKRKVARPQPSSNICRSLFNSSYCRIGNRCRFSHDLRREPCVWNSLGKCKYSSVQCRFSHEMKAEVSIVCFFYLMEGCFNSKCENKHSVDNFFKFISYENDI